MRVDGADRECLQRLDRVELPWTRTCRLAVPAFRTPALHRVLGVELADHLVEVQAHLRQALVRDLDEDLLGLGTKDLDLGHVLTCSST